MIRSNPCAPSAIAGLRRQRRRAAGFGLIELMIAVAIFALLTALLYAALWNGSRQLARLQAARDQSGDLLAARRAVRSVIETVSVAVPVEVGGQTEGGRMFVGEPLFMSFFASVDDQGSPQLYRVELAIEQQEGADGALTSRLVLRRQRRGAQAGRIEQADVLVRPGRLAFSFMAIDTGEGRWLPAWTAGNIIPGRVALIADGAAIMLASPKVSQDPRCIQKRGDAALATDECRVRQ